LGNLKKQEKIKIGDEAEMNVMSVKRIYGKNLAKITIEWRRVIRDAKTGKILEDVKQHNVITTAGLGIMASRFANPWSTHYWCLALGTGSGTPDPSDTGLFVEVSETRKSGSVSVPDTNQVQYYVRYMPEEANGYTYTEAGIFENTAGDLSGGTLLNHLMLSPTLEKTSDILVDFYITITFS